MPKYPGFIGGSSRSQSIIADVERTINLYVEELQGGRNQYALYPTPGFLTAYTLPQVGTRALFSMNQRTFAVVGTRLYELFSDFTYAERGTVAQDSYPATISYNGSSGGQLFVTSGGNGYCYTLATNVLTQVLTNEATTGAMLDGYFLAFNINTGKVRLSNLNDGSTWDSTNFFLRSTQPDPWQAMFVDGNRQLWLIGEQSGDVYYDTGVANQPFAPVPGSVFRGGIAAPFAFGLAGTNIVWLSRTGEGAGKVVAARGYVPLPVSTYAVENAIGGYARTTRISDAEMLVYQELGHTFVNLSFPSSTATWTLDVDKPSWHERGTWNSATNKFGLWAPRVHCYAFGQHLVGDRATNKIAIMDAGYATEFNSTAGIRRVRIAPGLTQEHARIPYHRLELLMETGVGLQGTAQGSDPQIMLRCSDDGGHTWGSERMAGIGKIGQYRKRVYWTKLGTAADRVFELSMSDPVPYRIVDAWINNLEGAEAA